MRNLTKFATRDIVGNVRANGLPTWRRKLPYAARAREVYKSIGTDLSDATEERQWRKYIHRATNVRNRNPDLTNHQCRVCNRAVESMEHLTECHMIRPFWTSCFTFIQHTAGHPLPFHRKKAIVLGQWGPTPTDPLGPEDARAFLRHAFGAMYHDFANVDLKNIPFNCDHAYYSTLL